MSRVTGGIIVRAQTLLFFHPGVNDYFARRGPLDFRFEFYARVNLPYQFHIA
jgi:hypothetical protein